MNDTRTCLADIHCKQYDRQAGHAWPTDQPLCDACLDHAQRDIQALVYDYLDLAQLHEASMSQAITEKTGGSKEKQMLIVGHVEALQAEIVHVLTTWEYELRVAARLSDLQAPAVIADWHTTISNPPPKLKVRAGTAVQRAVGIITPRLRMLSRLPATTVCATGIEDEHTEVTGWQAIHHMQALHQRARANLGRTRRTFWIPGECWACDARPALGVDGPLLRSEPREFEDPMQVTCDRCHASRPYTDYETYMTTLMWPGQATDDHVRVAA
jgi:hypothetical protein